MPGKVFLYFACLNRDIDWHIKYGMAKTTEIDPNSQAKAFHPVLMESEESDFILFCFDETALKLTLRNFELIVLYNTD